MKIKTPFTVISNSLKDIDRIHDFSSQLPDENQDDFWEGECKLRPTKSACKVYEV